MWVVRVHNQPLNPAAHGFISSVFRRTGNEPFCMDQKHAAKFQTSEEADRVCIEIALVYNFPVKYLSVAEEA